MNILAMSSYVPRHICDVQRFDGYKGLESISHYCGYAADYISQVKEDDQIDGAVYPKSCDSTRIISSYLQNVDKFKYQINIPARVDELAYRFYADELKKYKNSVELYYDITIDNIRERCGILEKDKEERIKLYNELPNISYVQYIGKIYKSMNMPLLSYREDWTGIDKSRNGCKKIYIIGSFLSNIDIINMIEETGMHIIGDNLPESGRNIYSPKIDFKDEDIMYQIARSVLGGKLSPTQNDLHTIISMDLDEIREKKADGVIYISQKYCEPYDFLYSCYKNALDEIGIPITKVELLNSSDDRKVKLKLEAFADTL